MKLRSLISTVSAYIDQYTDITLTKKEDSSLLTVNKVILESLELLETNPSPKREEKMVRALDKAFDKCIGVFANRGTPEILETQTTLEAERLEAKSAKSAKSSKKSKGNGMSKKQSKSKKDSKKIANQKEIKRQEKALAKLKEEVKAKSKAKDKQKKSKQPMGFRPEFEPDKALEQIASKMNLSPSKMKMAKRMIDDVAKDLEAVTLPNPRDLIKMMSEVPTIIQNNKSSGRLLNLMTEEIESMRVELKQLRKEVKKLKKDKWVQP